MLAEDSVSDPEPEHGLKNGPANNKLVDIVTKSSVIANLIALFTRACHFPIWDAGYASNADLCCFRYACQYGKMATSRCTGRKIRLCNVSESDESGIAYLFICLFPWCLTLCSRRFHFKDRCLRVEKPSVKTQNATVKPAVAPFKLATVYWSVSKMADCVGNNFILQRTIHVELFTAIRKTALYRIFKSTFSIENDWLVV